MRLRYFFSENIPLCVKSRWTFNPAVLTKVTGNGTAIVRNSENSPNEARFEVSDAYIETNMIGSRHFSAVVKTPRKSIFWI